MGHVAFNRRAFLTGVGGIAAGAAAASLTACETRTGPPAGEGSKVLIVRNFGGSYGEANRKAVYDPFTRETGIRIRTVNFEHVQMLAQIKEGRPQFDVMDLDMSNLLLFEHEGVSEPLDYGRLKNVRNAGIARSLLTPNGVGKSYWASVLAYRTDAFGGRKPESWADFWSLGGFPGTRALQGEVDFPELEFALLADGVPLDGLYPLDVDRAFKVLDEIRNSVGALWEYGAEPGELLSRGSVVTSSIWAGRLQTVIEGGSPLAYEWNGARRQSNGFGIPKGSANPDGAYRLIDFALRPEIQAHMARLYPDGPVVPAAYGHLTEATAVNLASTPGHLLSGFDLDIEWWLQNRDSVARRWQRWARTHD
ncbi:ABC transporter substrate-binding protein [Streptomyces cahuitamycinicus]|uniref:ABC transporter n=1 Tax=Streptomyces cahuitamycinicus TaxID=2070367 RepID=A0A2N8TX25_9ACTN|nr:ABC transporter substrate-binding protein [Streptomyces cahuitamycinicus]PNG23562.1 ABC transporter [Streptomyces cahuitamycinicus]